MAFASTSKFSRRWALLVTCFTMAVASPQGHAGEVDLGGLTGHSRFDQFIVKFRGAPAEEGGETARDQLLQRAATSISSSGASLQHSRRMALGADVVRLDKAVSRQDAETLMRTVALDPAVEYIEYDAIVHGAGAPNDARYDEQWSLFNNKQNSINAEAAWDLSTGNGIRVAVVDSGKTTHSDVNYLPNSGYDFVSTVSGRGDTTTGGSNDGNGRDRDPADSSKSYHGSRVAGVVAAVANNDWGTAGVAYKAKVIPVRVLGYDGMGRTSDFIDGMVWASGGQVAGVPANQYPASVINMSLGSRTSTGCSATYKNAINDVNSRGSIIVAAAMNTNENASRFMPANCDGVITVAASDFNGDRAFYSNYGDKIAVTAPGGEYCQIPTRFLSEKITGNFWDLCTSDSFAQGVLTTDKPDWYIFASGTSFAAPHVAGVVALMQSAVSPKKLTYSQVRSYLASTARRISEDKCPKGCGAGLIDAKAAVNAAINGL